MRWIPLLVLGSAVIGWFPAGAQAQGAEELFRKVNPSVVVIKAKGREVNSARGLVTYGEIGSGVLISADGKVMTAAHVVHSMDEIVVEFLGGESVPARVVASEPAADLSLLQLARVPSSAQPARLGDSDAVRVGQQVLVIGAPYGLSHSFSAGWISAKWLPNTAYRAMPLAEFFQTTATINTGNSGGPRGGLVERARTEGALVQHAFVGRRGSGGAPSCTRPTTLTSRPLPPGTLKISARSPVSTTPSIPSQAHFRSMRK